jgi:hypothetical protein
MIRGSEHPYRFPWSKTDNPGGWVEVTDVCDLHCAGCYRHRLEGHRPVQGVREEILAHRRLRNCDRIAIAGGEPLLYTDIVDIVEFIARQQMKPMILTNGASLTPDLAVALKKAGLKQFYFHVDSGQNRTGWLGKSESDLNRLRQHFADVCWDLGGVQCGYNTTVFRHTLNDIPEIVEWSRSNVHKVQHLSLIAYRALPAVEGMEFFVGGRRSDLTGFSCTTDSLDAISITTEEMLAVLQERFPDLQPCAYLNGTAVQSTRKFLVMVLLGSKRGVLGSVGGKTVELDQILYRLRHGRYSASMENPEVGKKVFLLSFMDRNVRKAFGTFLRSCARDPRRLFDRVYAQAVNLQQPNEIANGVMNLCEGCVNMMRYKGKWIHSCKLDEYRILGGEITHGLRSAESKSFPKDPVPFA